MPGTRITLGQKETFWACIREGASVAVASRQAGFSVPSGERLVKRASNGQDYRAMRAEKSVPETPIPLDDICDDAKAALADRTGYLFVKRYFGLELEPWQQVYWEQLEDSWDSPDREFVLMNAAPGGGKTLTQTAFACKRIALQRSIRVLWISRALSLSERNNMRVRRALDRTSPAFGAEATLSHDFGRFKPRTGGDVWKRDEFVVEQMDGSPIEEKEPTCSAFGFDSEWIGNRVELVLGDDLDSTRSTRNMEIVERNREVFDNELEPRLEPGGLFVVTQQRLGPFDFSAHCLSKKLLPEDDGSDDEPQGVAQYSHVIFKAHYDELCQGRETHKHDAPAWPKGCLLAPKRLPWRDIRKAMNNPTRFKVVYQQEDAAEDDALVQRVWVDGGRGTDGVDYLGCWDKDRGAWELPQGLTNSLGIITVDPSPTRFWSCLAEGTGVSTRRGEVPIESVTSADWVLTRDGWRPVQHRTFMGVKPTIRLELSTGRTLTLTPDHRVAVLGGWVEAGSLAPGDVVLSHRQAVTGSAPAPALADDRVLGRELVAVVAMGSGDERSDVRGASHVGASGDVLQVLRVDASPVAAQMVKFPLDLLSGVESVGEPVGQCFAVATQAAHDAAVASRRSALPNPAAVLVDDGAFGEVGVVYHDPTTSSDGAVATADARLPGAGLDWFAAPTETHVVSITSGPSIAVYDIGVLGDRHEFTAEGIIVHNCQAWVVNPASEQRFLLDLHRERMDAPEFLDWSSNLGTFTGLLEDWWHLYKKLGVPLTHVVVEVNAAQRFMLQYDHFHKWTRLRKVMLVPHNTARNKADADYGVQMIAPKWQFGQVRLPGRNTSPGRIHAMRLVDEVLRYPNVATTDCVMGQWFLEHNLNALTRRTGRKPMKADSRRPSWAA